MQYHSAAVLLYIDIALVKNQIAQYFITSLEIYKWQKMQFKVILQLIFMEIVFV